MSLIKIIGRLFRLMAGSVLFLAFFSVGAGVILIGTVGPALKVMLSQGWIETPCTILSSEVVGKDTFQVAISYEYEFGGRQYTGDRYSFFSGSTAGRVGKQKVVDEFPVGAQRNCYVDSAEPSQAVLSRKFSWSMLWGLVGVPFAAVGVFGLWGIVRSNQKRPARTGEFDDLHEDSAHSSDFGNSRGMTLPDYATLNNDEFSERSLEDQGGPLILKRETSRIGAFLGMAFIALVWNGVIVVAGYNFFGDLKFANLQWILMLFVAVFGLVGLGLIVGTVYHFLGLFNPVPVLSLSRTSIPLGGSAQLDWHFEGSIRSLSSFKVFLKGVEKATYRQGTKTRTDENVFYNEVIFETDEPLELERGSVTVKIPSDSIHTLTAPNNKIIWTLSVQGGIVNWPDVTGSYPVRVVPHE